MPLNFTWSVKYIEIYRLKDFLYVDVPTYLNHFVINVDFADVLSDIRYLYKQSKG